MGETIIVGVCTPCPNGTYNLVKNVQPSTQCVDCTQTEGILGCHSRYIKVKPKYWRRHSDTYTVLPCFAYFDEGCNGGYNTGDKSCRFNFEGPLCATCMEEFYNDGIQCISCSNTSSPFTVTIYALEGFSLQYF